MREGLLANNNFSWVFFLQAGAALNSTDNKGVTPLMLAAKGNHIDILKYLIGAGASVSYTLPLPLPAYSAITKSHLAG